MSMLPIQYRDFHDFPRAFIIEHEGHGYFFDCPFDVDLDDYPDHFRIYQMDLRRVRAIGAGSWEGLAAEGKLVGQAPTHLVRFDPTQRAAVDDAVLKLI